MTINSQVFVVALHYFHLWKYKSVMFGSIIMAWWLFERHFKQSSKIPESILRKELKCYLQWLPKFRLFNVVGYGMTETGPVVSWGPLEKCPSGSVGVLVPNTECKVCVIYVQLSSTIERCCDITQTCALSKEQKKINK